MWVAASLEDIRLRKCPFVRCTYCEMIELLTLRSVAEAHPYVQVVMMTHSA